MYYYHDAPGAGVNVTTLCSGLLPPYQLVKELRTLTLPGHRIILTGS